MSELTLLGEVKISQNNMDELAVAIKQEIAEKYDIIVTEDTVSDSKKLMAEINKQKDSFKKTYKEFKEKLLAPISPLDSKAKEIETYYEQARAAVEMQVKKFEAGKLAKAKEVCEAYRDEVCAAKGIATTAITITDLCGLLGSVTSTDKISSSAKEKIDARVQAVEIEMLKAKAAAEEKAKEEELKKLQDAEYKRACEERKQVIEETPKQKTQNGIYRITAVFELKADSKNEAIEMAKDLMGMIGVEAQIGAE